MAGGRNTGGPGGDGGRRGELEGLRRLGRGQGAAGHGRASDDRLAALGEQIDERQAPRGRRRKRASARVRRRRLLVGGLSALLLLIAIFGGGYLYLRYRFDQIPKVDVGSETAYSGGPLNVLVIGSDSRAGLTGQQAAQAGASLVQGQRSDVDMIWHINADTHQITILSIPRDTMTSMSPALQSEFGTYNRINAAFDSGPTELVKVIQDNFGIPINDTIQVNFAGFSGAVDALGGVKMYFPYPAKDAYSGLNVTQTGCQLLNGVQALSVARSRHYQYEVDGQWYYDGSSDFGRIQRQDAFLKALINSAKSKINPLTINAFLGSIPQGVTLDRQLSFSTLVNLGVTFHSFNPNSLVTETLPTTGLDTSTWGDVLFASQPAAQELLVGIFGNQLNLHPATPPPNTDLESVPPPVVTSTTAPPATAATQATSAVSAATTPAVTTTTAPPYNPSAC
jgi:LCP family protein required for cell wall assembly